MSCHFQCKIWTFPIENNWSYTGNVLSTKTRDDKYLECLPRQKLICRFITVEISLNNMLKLPNMKYNRILEVQLNNWSTTEYVNKNKTHSVFKSKYKVYLKYSVIPRRPDNVWNNNNHSSVTSHVLRQFPVAKDEFLFKNRNWTEENDKSKKEKRMCFSGVDILCQRFYSFRTFILCRVTLIEHPLDYSLDHLYIYQFDIDLESITTA